MRLDANKRRAIPHWRNELSLDKRRAQLAIAQAPEYLMIRKCRVYPHDYASACLPRGWLGDVNRPVNLEAALGELPVGFVGAPQIPGALRVRQMAKELPTPACDGHDNRIARSQHTGIGGGLDILAAAPNNDLASFERSIPSVR
ncbi:MAG TPA: hypothetical protein VG271_15875 [Beijerinckiaceae bacterium]|nr:hypothetical protein [Beijerinckiaceae bacterium]